MNNDETAQDFEHAVAMMEFEIERAWLLDPVRPIIERLRDQLDPEEREAVAQMFQGIVDKLKREIN